MKIVVFIDVMWYQWKDCWYLPTKVCGV